MGEKEWTPATVFEVVGDALARRILVAASEEPRSADDLAAAFDVSRPTVYRRVNPLVEYELLRARQRLDADGNHYQEFETTLSKVTLEISDGSCTLDLERRGGLAERFESFWSELEGSSSGRGTGLDRPHDPTES